MSKVCQNYPPPLTHLCCQTRNESVSDSGGEERHFLTTKIRFTTALRLRIAHPFALSLELSLFGLCGRNFSGDISPLLRVHLLVAIEHFYNDWGAKRRQKDQLVPWYKWYMCALRHLRFLLRRKSQWTRVVTWRKSPSVREFAYTWLTLY